MPQYSEITLLGIYLWALLKPGQSGSVQQIRAVLSKVCDGLPCFYPEGTLQGEAYLQSTNVENFVKESMKYFFSSHF